MENGVSRVDIFRIVTLRHTPVLCKQACGVSAPHKIDTDDNDQTETESCSHKQDRNLTAPIQMHETGQLQYQLDPGHDQDHCQGD